MIMKDLDEENKRDPWYQPCSREQHNDAPQSGIQQLQREGVLRAHLVRFEHRYRMTSCLQVKIRINGWLIAAKPKNTSHGAEPART